MLLNCLSWSVTSNWSWHTSNWSSHNWQPKQHTNGSLPNISMHATPSHVSCHTKTASGENCNLSKLTPQSWVPCYSKLVKEKIACGSSHEDRPSTEGHGVLRIREVRLRHTCEEVRKCTQRDVLSLWPGMWWDLFTCGMRDTKAWVIRSRRGNRGIRVKWTCLYWVYEKLNHWPPFALYFLEFVLCQFDLTGVHRNQLCILWTMPLHWGV